MFFHGKDSAIWQRPIFQNLNCCSYHNSDKCLQSLSQWTPTQYARQMNRMKKTQVEHLKNDPAKIVRLRPDFPLEGDKRLGGRVAEALSNWRDSKWIQVYGKSRFPYSRQIIMSDTVIDRIAVLNTWFVGTRGAQFLDYFVDWHSKAKYGAEVLEILGRVVEDDEHFMTLADWRKRVKVQKDQQECAVALARKQMRIRRYGENLPRSEVPGDAVDKADSTRSAGGVKRSSKSTGQSKVIGNAAVIGNKPAELESERRMVVPRGENFISQADKEQFLAEVEQETEELRDCLDTERDLANDQSRRGSDASGSTLNSAASTAGAETRRGRRRNENSTINRQPSPAASTRSNEVLLTRSGRLSRSTQRAEGTRGYVGRRACGDMQNS